MEASSIEVACNVIVQDDSASEAPSAEATDSQNASSSISSGATYSRVTSTEIASSQPSSPETVISEFKPLPTDHHEEVLADEAFKENPVNWSQIPNLIGDVWTDEILDKEEKLLEVVQDLFLENAPCSAITEDGNAAVKCFQQMRRINPLIQRVIFQTKSLLQKLLKLVEVPALAVITTKITTNLPFLM